MLETIIIIGFIITTCCAAEIKDLIDHVVTISHVG